MTRAQKAFYWASLIVFCWAMPVLANEHGVDDAKLQFAWKLVSEKDAPDMVLPGRGPISNFMLAASYQQWSAYTGFDFPHGKQKVTEKDLGVGRWFNLGRALDGVFKLYLGGEIWDYGTYADLDARARIAYSGPVDVVLMLDKIVTRPSDNHHRAYLQVSKTLPIFRDLTAKPSISTAFDDDFYDFSGWTRIEIGLGLEYPIGPFAIKASLFRQFGMIDGVEDKTFGALTLSYNFNLKL